MPLQAGSTFGRYHVISALGSGGMGDVFLAHDTRLNRRVALKLLRPADSLDADRLRRFVQEAQTASVLTHPNIAVVFDIGEHEGSHFIAMEHVEGRSLAEQLQAGPIPPRDLIALAIQIGEALQAAHAVGIVHRDVKPSNVMITAAAQAKVLDFGLAKFVAKAENNANADTRMGITAPHVVVGTAAYMSPEQSIGGPVDHRTDLFSLGVLLYEAATGCLPFIGQTAFETMDRIRHAQPQSITTLKPDLPEELNRIIGKCLAKQPASRYQTAGELLTDLRILGRRSDPDHAPLVADRPAHNLPGTLTTFVGRGKEIAHLLEALASARLLTLTGAGGSGKTRLAQQVAARTLGSFPQGAWFVDLASTTNPELLVNVVARVLDVPEKPGVSLEQALLNWLRPRTLLLILDNCEHLVDVCAAFAEGVLQHAPAVRILATSREALNVPGETVWRVPVLAVPDFSAPLEPQAILGFDAIRLFCDRAAAVGNFQLTEENAAAVADICRRLDGVPLALELAAARTKVLTVAQIRDRLHDRFRLLAGGGRTAVARQRTLEATVDWSYDLLDSVERQLLARLSVFSGGWTLEAAEHVCSGHGIEPGDILDLLAKLVDKSLVIVEDVGSERRYRLLETIRQYARDRLVQAGDVAALAQIHLDYFLGLARQSELQLLGADQAAWLARLDLEHDNLRAALDWALGDAARRADGLALANRVWWFWAKRGYFSEGKGHLERALAEQPSVPPGVEARALIGLVHLATFAGGWDASRLLVARALDAARAAADPWSEAYALDFMAILNAETGGEIDESERLARQALDVASAAEDPYAWQPLALAMRLIGYSALQRGRVDEASEWLEKSLAVLRQRGDVWSTGILLTDLAGLRVIEGRHEDARACAREALACAQVIRDRRGVGWCLQTIAMLEAAAARAQRAAWLYGAGEALLESIGAAGQVLVTQVQDRYLGPARQALGDAAFREASARGRATSVSRLMEMDPGAFASA